MVHVTIKLTFDNAGQPQKSWEKTVQIDAPRTPEGEEYLAEYMILELQKEALWEGYHDQLPSISDLLQGVRQSGKVSDLSAFQSRINVSRLWFEIRNSLLAALSLLAQARTCKALEPQYKEDRRENMLLYRVHFKKMEQFNLAVVLVAKIEDLILRLVFEGLDGTIIPHDPDDPDWERSLNIRRVSDALSKRTEIPLLTTLPDDEYREIRGVVIELRGEDNAEAEPKRGEDFVNDFIEYRNRLVHRITPSVDYHEFYVLLETRKVEAILDSAGKQIGTRQGFGAVLTEAEYSFVELYELTVRTLEHHISLLRRLKNTARFS